METERLCLFCGTVLDPLWARSNQKYCTPIHRSLFWYHTKTKVYYASEYQKLKRAWERSPTGKRAGIKLYKWRRIPKDWR